MGATWLGGYLQGSFRGVKFFTRNHQTAGGRRLVNHVYPLRDNKDYEDLGRSEKPFNMSAYVVDDNYYGQRNDLIAALDAPGPGKLVHPYLGVWNVVVDTWSESEATEQGRVANFDITFKEQELIQLTVVIPNTGALVAAAKKSFLEKLLAFFEEAYDIVSKPISALEDVTETIDKALDVVDAIKKVANTQAEFKQAISNLKGKLIELRMSGKILGAAFSDIVNFGTDATSNLVFGVTAADALQQYGEMENLKLFDDEPVVDSPGDISMQPDYPSFQVQKLVTHCSLAAKIGLSSEIPFDSAEAAENLEASLFEDIDEVLNGNFIDDEMYAALRQCKAAVRQDLELRAINLPRLVNFQTVETSNVLQIANEIYGDLEEVEDIVKRNNIQHPGFISGARTIQVRVDE